MRLMESAGSWGRNYHLVPPSLPYEFLVSSLNSTAYWQPKNQSAVKPNALTPASGLFERAQHGN